MEKKKNYLRNNRKLVLGASAFLACVVVIVLCSFFPFIIDPSRWQNSEFLSDELLITAITIFALVCLMFIAQSSNAMNPNSKIARAKVKFYGTDRTNADNITTHIEGSVERITKHENISAFCQWVKRVLQPKDIRSAKERIMSKAGITDFSIIELESSEIKALIGTPQKYGDKFYKGITKKQAMEAIRAKSLRISLVDPSYYLTCSSIDNDQTVTERSGNEGKKKATLLTFSIVSKVVISVVIAMIFASLVKDTSAGGDQSTAWMKFATRMMALATSSFMGYMVGCQTNDIDAEFIEMKCLVHAQFFEDKEFKPMSQQEEAKQEFVERVRKENVLALGNGTDVIQLGHKDGKEQED